jgi:hypothetical protein
MALTNLDHNATMICIRGLLRLLLLAITIATAACSSSGGGSVAHTRDVMYVGGSYTSDGAGGHIFTNQMYVEKLMPAAGSTQPYPIVLIHGQAQTGTVIMLHCFSQQSQLLTTPETSVSDLY